uniref:Putative two dm9 repeat protein n=1 Tax=Panstrongylus megistus TaxID=65343 RepID=A0A069DR30_9HEMI
MEGWHRKCGCGCSTPGIPCRGFTPVKLGDYGGHRGLLTPQPYTAPPQRNISAGDYGGHRGLLTPQPYTAPPQRNSSGYGWIPPSHCLGTFRWETCFGGSVPADAVHAGTDLNGAPIYVGRSFHGGDLLPAKVTPAHGCAYISYAGSEISKQDYEVLCSNHVAWKFCEGGAVPPEAIRIGNTSDGEHLFMGRTMVEGTLTPGKVHPSHGCLYVPFDGRELSFPTYEVLVLS